MRLYDVVNLTPETIVEKETNTAIAHSPSPDSHRNTVLISDNSIADTTPESKPQNQTQDTSGFFRFAHFTVQKRK